MQEHIENSFTYEASKGKVFHTQTAAVPSILISQGKHKNPLCSPLNVRER